MAKTVFQIKPKLNEDVKPALPVQDFSPEKILEIVQQTAPQAPPVLPPQPRANSESAQRKPKARAAKNKPAPKNSGEPKKPQGRPRREESVKRLSSDLPAEIYDKVQQEIKAQGYTLNGFLAKVLREYFAKQNN